MGSSCKISRELLDDIIIGEPKLSIGLVEDNFIRDQLTANLSAYVYANTMLERELVYYCEPPTFFDWLFRRKRRVVFTLIVNDILKNPPKNNEVRIAETYPA